MPSIQNRNIEPRRLVALQARLSVAHHRETWCKTSHFAIDHCNDLPLSHQSATSSDHPGNMSDEILNANPAIRNTSDLPSRRRQASPHSSKQHALGLFSSTVPACAYSPDPFAPSTSSDEENSDDDDIVEPIDEQEIYGMSRDLITTWSRLFAVILQSSSPEPLSRSHGGSPLADLSSS